MPLRLERGAMLRSAPVLPDDGIVDGLARRALPDEGGLALIGDADTGDCRGRKTGLAEDLAHRGKRRLPNLLGIMLDPAGSREDLPEFLLTDIDRRKIRSEDDSAGRRRALVDDENMPSHGHYQS